MVWSLYYKIILKKKGKKLVPVYNKLQSLTKNIKNLVIAKIDATKNYSPIKIDGYPTIFLFPSNNKVNTIF
jgi:hypothetical protein